MKSEMSAILFGLTMLGALSLHALADASTSDPRSDQFRREMLPKVGQKITIVGTIAPGKLGPLLTSQSLDRDIYIVTTTTNRADLAKLNVVNRLVGHTLKVVGPLHHAEAPSSGSSIVTSAPEHFFFDVAEISFSEVKSEHNEKQKAN